MMEKLVPLKLPPGFFHNGTKYEAKGRWYDGNLVRWHEGALQPVGGWVRAREDNAGSDLAALAGTPVVYADIIVYDSPSVGVRVVIATDTGVYAYDPEGSATAVSTITPAAYASSVPQLTLFGDKVIIYQNGKIYEWAGALASVATQVGGTVNSFTTWGGVLATPERFLVALGGNSTHDQVWWASQESTSDWTPSATNTAGDLRLGDAGRIVGGKAMSDRSLIWTLNACWSLNYIGGQAVYSIRKEGGNCGIISPHAAAVVDNRAFWMGPDGFFVYDGWVRPLPCDVADKVFGEIDLSGWNESDFNYSPVHAHVVPEFNEIWWLYPTSGGNLVNDRYVAYNYRDNFWHYGAFDRISAATRTGPVRYPIMLEGTTGYLWYHENGNARTGVTAYVESGPLEIGAGDQVMRVQRVVPDETTLGQVAATLYSSFDPTTAETTNGPFTAAQPTDVRFSGRQVRLKLAEAAASDWRVGTFRLGVIPQGRR